MNPTKTFSVVGIYNCQHVLIDWNIVLKKKKKKALKEDWKKNLESRMQRKVTFKDKYVNCSAVDIIYICHHRSRRRWSCIYAPHLSESPQIVFCIKLHFRCQTSSFSNTQCQVLKLVFLVFFLIFFFKCALEPRKAEPNKDTSIVRQ